MTCDKNGNDNVLIGGIAFICSARQYVHLGVEAHCVFNINKLPWHLATDDY